MIMRKFITYIFTIIMMLIFLQHHLVASLSPIEQKIALFQFKQSLTVSTTPTNCSYKANFYYFYYDLSDIPLYPSHPKTMNWSMSSDHCTWEGVTCERKTGNVIGLDLSCSQLEGAILPNSTLFQLSHLRVLNLSQNDFSRSDEFPQEFGFFAKGLTHLNLYRTRFSGRVPSGISHLYKLVLLDLSLSNVLYCAELEDEVFKSLVRNLNQLRVLDLQYVNISSVLPVHFSTSLRVLNLAYTGLYGTLLQEVFHLPKLERLDLSSNKNLTVTLPKVKWGSSSTLQHLNLAEVNLPGGLPDSVGFLESLATFQLFACNLSGPIPISIANLGQLTYLGLHDNNLNGPIPTFLTNLTNLITLHLNFNSLTGPLPPWLFEHSSLEFLDLSSNWLTGQLYEFNSSKSQLHFFSCGNNLLNGFIPHSFSQLVNLTDLDFSSNNLSGILDMEMFSRLECLNYLDLSDNHLLVRSTSTATLPPMLTDLVLSSCNMKEFPHFSRDAEISLEYVDLSNNEIDGEIPHWIGSVSWYLNLSRNRLTSGLEQLPWNDIAFLDLQYNMFNGSLPNLVCNSSSLQVLNLSYNNLSLLPNCSTNTWSLSVLDLRMNNIQGNIPATLSNLLYLETINLSGNKLEGRIPSSFAEFRGLQILDLGSNQINDTFPQCLEALPYLQVLVLKSNKFHGLINKSSKTEHPFPCLRIIDLSYNDFSGPLPVIYFRNFKAMMNGNVNKIKASYKLLQ